MESEKNKKLFPELEEFSGSESAAEERETPFSEGPASTHGNAVASETPVSRFQIQEPLWEGLMQEPWFLAEFEGRVASRIQELARTEIEPELEKHRTAGFEAGRSEGRQLAQAEVSQALKVLEQAAATLVQEKSKLLFEHEKAWVETLITISKKCFVFEPERLRQPIETFLESERGQFEASGKVIVRLNPETMAQASWILNNKPTGFDLVADDNVPKQGIEVGFGNCGILFSTEAAVKQLEKIAFESLNEKEPQKPVSGGSI